MALAFVKQNNGTSTTATTTPAFGTATTAGNLIVIAVAADDYNGTPPTGWTQEAEMEQQSFLGAYIWWRISAGETTLPDYTIGSVTNSSWVVAEFSGNDASPYDISEGQNNGDVGTASYTTPTIVPSTGERLLVAAILGSDNNSEQATPFTAWTNSFIRIEDAGQNVGARMPVGLAYRIVTGDGSTSFSTGATFPSAVNSASGLIISFKEEEAEDAPMTLMGQACM